MYVEKAVPYIPRHISCVTILEGVQLQKITARVQLLNGQSSVSLQGIHMFDWLFLTVQLVVAGLDS